MRRSVVGAVLVMVFAGCGKDDKPPTTVPPTGACCAPAGTCTVTTEADCSGVWTLNHVCATNPCPPPPPTGSCCAVNGICAVTTQTACTGTWTEAGVCTPNPCQQPPTGSCCVPAGICTVTTQANCSGNWRQAGSCEPNPCPTQPPPTGMVWIPAGTVRLGEAGVLEPGRLGLDGGRWHLAAGVLERARSPWRWDRRQRAVPRNRLASSQSPIR
jgi:hypothetical protein